MANGGLGNDVVLTAFDEFDQLMGSVTALLATQPFGDFSFIGLTSTVDIARVELISAEAPPDDDFLIDDFSVWPSDSDPDTSVCRGGRALPVQRKRP